MQVAERRGRDVHVQKHRIPAPHCDGPHFLTQVGARRQRLELGNVDVLESAHVIPGRNRGVVEFRTRVGVVLHRELVQVRVAVKIKRGAVVLMHRYWMTIVVLLFDTFSDL